MENIPWKLSRLMLWGTRHSKGMGDIFLNPLHPTPPSGHTGPKPGLPCMPNLNCCSMGWFYEEKKKPFILWYCLGNQEVHSTSWGGGLTRNKLKTGEHSTMNIFGTYHTSTTYLPNLIDISRREQITKEVLLKYIMQATVVLGAVAPASRRDLQSCC